MNVNRISTSESMSNLRARVTPVKVGKITIQGLMLPNGSFAVGVSQVAELFSLNKAVASREVKALLGKGIPLNKTKSELHSKEVNIISLADFEKIVVELTIKGNQKAADFNRLMVGLSLHQLFSDSFKIKFEAEERQDWLEYRQEHRKQYHPEFTVWTKEDNACNQFGIRMNQLKAKLGLPIENINTYNSQQLRKLNLGEVRYGVLREVGLTHEEAMEKVR